VCTAQGKVKTQNKTIDVYSKRIVSTIVSPPILLNVIVVVQLLLQFSTSIKITHSLYVYVYYIQLFFFLLFFLLIIDTDLPHNAISNIPSCCLTWTNNFHYLATI